MKEIKDRLATTRQKSKQTCPSASPTLKDAIPHVEVKEKPGALDDNIFHKDEPITVAVGALYREGNSYAKEPVFITGTDVIIRYADGGVQKEKTDENGEVQMYCPRAVGETHIEIPELSMYSNSIKMKIVE